ncbi:hypothetical protein LWI28_021284 [Acer negundo]|uniref:Retrotransposon gag domain-containing protein n=1 Tax=Acer negundo TaxID=4023 RepID=A0AAD5IB55_ACENE|nr:hypothetical protein LWI28_021284 [Acer negundo]
MPAMEQFIEENDHIEHVDHFLDLMATQTEDDRILCQALLITFEDLTSNWFRQIPGNSISSFNQLSKAFIVHFMGSLQHKKSLSHLSSMRQGENETIHEYLSCFNKEAVRVEDFNNVATINTFDNGLQSGIFFISVKVKLPSFITYVGGYSRGICEGRG